MPSIVKEQRDVLFFIDADAVLEPAAITSVLHVMEAENVDMVASLFVTKEHPFLAASFCL